MSALVTPFIQNFPLCRGVKRFSRQYATQILHTTPSNKKRTPLAGRGISSTTIIAMSNSTTALIQQKNSENPVMVYSKTYCPYCSEVKSLFSRLGVQAKIVELDQIADGDDIQLGLQEVTGRRTVPQIFIGGNLVGGCDDTVAAYNSGELQKLLATVDISI